MEFLKAVKVHYLKFPLQSGTRHSVLWEKLVGQAFRYPFSGDFMNSISYIFSYLEEHLNH